MAIQYTNRQGKTYYLHQGVTKKGNPKYYFSMKSEGDLVDEIPAGFEIYENPNAQVFLRRTRPKIITDEEMAIVEQGMRQFSSERHYQIDVKKNVIIVFTPNQDVDAFMGRLGKLFQARGLDAASEVAKFTTYSPILQFVLINQEKRTFLTRRYCFLGSIDDWIDIGRPDTLPKLVKEYVKHLGQDSYYELY